VGSSREEDEWEYDEGFNNFAVGRCNLVYNLAVLPLGCGDQNRKRRGKIICVVYSLTASPHSLGPTDICW